jgi:lipoic acid synthetase
MSRKGIELPERLAHLAAEAERSDGFVQAVG